jgi:hypothetical protein
MDNKEIINVLKRYINNKFTKTNLLLKNVDSKMNILIDYLDKTKRVTENNEKKIRTLNTYLYKAMRNIHTLIESSSELVVSNEEVKTKSKDEYDSAEMFLMDSMESTSSNKSIKELKVEDMDIENDVIIKYFRNKDIKSDISFFKYLYVDINGECPIRYLNKNNFQYWSDGKWIDDNGAEEIIEIVLKNLSKMYIKNNTFDNFGTNIDKYQSHIYSMKDKKYRENFVKKMKELVRI